MADTQVILTRTINAPVETVFDAVAHIENFQKAIPHIAQVEFLTEQRRGVGTRFRETRMMGKRENKTTLEVTEYVDNAHIRLVSDEGNTIWDTLFTVTQVGAGSELEMKMDVRPYKLSSKVAAKLIMGFVTKAIAADLDMIKAHCEG